MIHATKRAIAAVLRRATGQASLSGVSGASAACSGNRLDGHDFFSDHDAIEMVAGRAFEDFPTCPACLVLLDDAMVRRVSP